MSSATVRIRAKARLYSLNNRRLVLTLQWGHSTGEDRLAEKYGKGTLTRRGKERRSTYLRQYGNHWDSCGRCKLGDECSNWLWFKTSEAQCAFPRMEMGLISTHRSHHVHVVPENVTRIFKIEAIALYYTMPEKVLKCTSYFWYIQCAQTPSRQILRVRMIFENFPPYGTYRIKLSCIHSRLWQILKRANCFAASWRYQMNAISVVFQCL